MTKYILMDMSSDEDSMMIALTETDHADRAEQKFRDAGFIDDGKSLEESQMEIWRSEIIIVE